MKILILGAGQVGATLAEALSSEHDITLIDSNPDVLLKLQQRLDIRTVTGFAADPAILEQANGEDAELLIAVTSSDEVNMIACQIAYALFKTPSKIARVRSGHLERYPELFTSGNLAIDNIINPAELVTERLVRQIEHPGTLMVFDFAGGKLQIAGLRTTPPCRLNGRKVQELAHDLAGLDAQVIGIIRDERVLIAKDDTIIKPHDVLLYCAVAHKLNKATQSLLGTDHRYRRIMIAGGGNIGIALSKQLEGRYKVKLLEHNQRQGEFAAESLKNTVVLIGDSADTELLKSENISEVDLFCSVTNDDEANIMSAIVAKRLGARSTVALVNRQTYAHFLIERSPDIDMALSPQRITGGKILTFLRKGDIADIYPFPNGSGEALEVVVHGDMSSSKVVGRTQEQLKLPAETKLCAIVRGEDVIFPDESTVIADQDRLVFVMADWHNVSQLEKLIQVAPGFI